MSGETLRTPARQHAKVDRGWPPRSLEVEVERLAESRQASTRAELVARLRVRRLEIEEAIFARICADVSDAAAREDSEYVAGLRAAVAVAVDYALTGIERGAEWSGPIPHAVLTQARRAARIGVPFDIVIRRYLLGHTLLGDFMMEEAEHEGDSSSLRTAVRDMLREQASVLDRLTVSIASEYMREVERTRRTPDQRRLELVQALLAGTRNESTELGYELDAEHLGMIVVGARAGQAVQGLAVQLKCQLLSVARDEETVWAWLGGSHRLTTADLERAISDDDLEALSLAIGEPGRGVSGWRLTHRQAQAALSVAVRRPQKIAQYADVALIAFALRDEALARSLIGIYISPLDNWRDGGAALRETLRAYFAAGHNAASTAAALGVDRRTIWYRLSKVEALLGRPLRTRLPEIEIALRLEELLEPSHSYGQPEPQGALPQRLDPVSVGDRLSQV
jgi:hypothetical protein